MLQFSCRFACYHVIVSQTAWVPKITRVCYALQSVVERIFLAALEAQIFVNNP